MTFIVGDPAQGEAFYGRERELDAVLHQPWAWICGQRRSGKTSMLLRLEQEAKERAWVPLYFALEVVGERESNGHILFQRFFRANDRKYFRPRNIHLSEFE